MRCLPLLLLGLGLSLALPAGAQTTDPSKPQAVPGRTGAESAKVDPAAAAAKPSANGAGTAVDRSVPPSANTNRNVSATGRVMPPTTGRTPGLGSDPAGGGRGLAAGAKDTTGKDASKNTGKTGAKADKTAARAPGALKPSTEAEMIKAQKANEARNKAWDTRMRKTMSSICTGC